MNNKNKNRDKDMNIFVLHLCPKVCAMYHCDKHVVKMILETTQLLYTCIMICCQDIENRIKTAPYTLSGNQGYKIISKNHPCSLWLRESVSNYEWLINLGKELCKEYEYRYEKKHACVEHIKWLETVAPDIPDIGITKFRLVMKDDYKEVNYSDFKNVTESYRNYYNKEKRKFAKWSKREVPKWFLKN